MSGPMQNDVAAVLQDAAVTEAAASWLAVRAATHSLLIPLSHAGEVSMVGEVQRLPHVKPWFLGVINLRGVLSSVIDLAAFLDQTVASVRSDAVLTRCQLIRFNPLLQVNSALLVDEIIGMRSPRGYVRSIPRQADEASFLSTVYIDEDARRWRELNLQRLAADPLFLDVQA